MVKPWNPRGDTEALESGWGASPGRAATCTHLLSQVRKRAGREDVPIQRDRAKGQPNGDSKTRIRMVRITLIKVFAVCLGSC